MKAILLARGSPVVTFTFLAAACASREPAAPPPTDEALGEGERLELPLAGPFPRLGLQWVYDARIEGFPDGTSAPPRVAYRLTARDQAGHPWAGWWMKGKGRPMEFAGAIITETEVIFRPPRLFPFEGEVSITELQDAPWPVARPGRPGTHTQRLPLDEAWQSVSGQEAVKKTYTDVGPAPVTVPAGQFENAWLVEGTSPGWKGRFWWVDRAGWARMLFLAGDGRSIDFQLAEVRRAKPLE